MPGSMAVRSATAAGGQARATPALRVRYASFEARVAGATLDLLVLFIIAALLVTAGSMVVLVSSDFEKIDPSTMSINVFWVCVAAIAPAIILYFFVSYAWKGQTVGLAVMQLMVIRSDGRPLGVLGSMARVMGLLVYAFLLAAGAIGAYVFKDATAQAAGAIGIATFLAVAGLLWAVFDSRRRALHDRIAGTIVVRIQ